MIYRVTSVSPIGFCIEFVPGATPIVSISYRSSVSEIRELAMLLLEHRIRVSCVQARRLGRVLIFAEEMRNGLFGMCIDCSELNKLTVKSCYPFPQTNDWCDQLPSVSYFSKIVLRSGYH